MLLTKLKKKNDNKKTKLIKVILVNENLEERESYTLDSFSKIMSGFVELNPSYKEKDVRESLVEIFKSKYHAIENNDFEFDSLEKNVVTSPNVASGFEWDYNGIKALVGQGRLCCRLTCQAASILRRGQVPVQEQVPKPSSKAGPFPTQGSSSSSVSQASSSSYTSVEEKICTLQEMFKDGSVEEIRNALHRSSLSVDQAAVILLNVVSDSDMPQVIKTNINNILVRLRRQLSMEREKLKVDPEDIIADAFCYYKNSTLNLKKRLRIIYEGQPAADTGGVLRQFYTDLLQKCIDTYFEGDAYKMPVYNVANGPILTVIGKIVVHSILQEGPGLPIFSPAMYNYLVTENVDRTLNVLTTEDCSIHVKYYIDEVTVCFHIIFFLQLLSQIPRLLFSSFKNLAVKF